MTTLWNWIPQRLTLYPPSLLFTTEVNGTSMATLFNVLDELEHCIIVIKTFENEVSALPHVKSIEFETVMVNEMLL